MTNKKIKHYTLLALKGAGMGAANVVPGVSGGTIALMTGIYSELVEAVNVWTEGQTWRLLFSGQWKAFWKQIHGSFLTTLFIGIIVSILSLAKMATWLLNVHPVQIWAFFFGLIIASSYIMLKDVKQWTMIDVIKTILGAVAGVAICTLTPTQTPDAMWFIILCGALAMCTMILPGISGSFVLLIMGKYDYIMNAIGDMNLPVLGIFCFGAVAGLLAFSKFLNWLLKRYERSTMLILIGFVIGSLVKVWPWFDLEPMIEADGLNPTNLPIEALDIPANSMHIPGAIIWCLAGFAFVMIIERLGNKAKN